MSPSTNHLLTGNLASKISSPVHESFILISSKVYSFIQETPYRYELAAQEMEYQSCDKQRVRCSRNRELVCVYSLQRLHVHCTTIRASLQLLDKHYCICRSPSQT